MSVRESFLDLITEPSFLQRMFAHMVNNRVQDFQDPLTSTLVIMATSPMQMVLCEAGILPFKTTLLPVVPYALLTVCERKLMQDIISRVPDDHVSEAIESSGQYTLTVLPFTHNVGTSSTVTHMCKKRLLCALVESIRSKGHPDVVQALCNIVLQRFMAQISTPSDVAAHVMVCCQGESKKARLLQQAEAV
jgi:hypothetical protein